MSWAVELREAIAQLQSGGAVQVGFAGVAGLEGELGRELNTFSEELRRMPGDNLNREQRHDLRNRLAGILAAVHVLRETADLATEDREVLQQALEEAKALDARLRGGG
jgi:hypothetical protein